MALSSFDGKICQVSDELMSIQCIYIVERSLYDRTVYASQFTVYAGGSCMDVCVLAAWMTMCACLYQADPTAQGSTNTSTQYPFDFMSRSMCIAIVQHRCLVAIHTNALLYICGHVIQGCTRSYCGSHPVNEECSEELETKE